MNVVIAATTVAPLNSTQNVGAASSKNCQELVRSVGNRCVMLYCMRCSSGSYAGNQKPVSDQEANYRFEV